MYDQFFNFGIFYVIEAPTPALSGTTIRIKAIGGVSLPEIILKQMSAVVFPSGEDPTIDNAEIIKIISGSDGFYTIERAQEDTTAKPIAFGNRVYFTTTAKTINQLITDIENSSAPSLTKIKTFGQINANTTLNINTSGANYNVSGDIGDLGTDETDFNSNAGKRVLLNGAELEKGVAVFFVTTTSLYLVYNLDSDDLIQIYS